MSKHLKLFERHSEYETYINGSDKLLSNVSYCIDNNDVHYNPLPIYLTPKEILTYIFNLQKGIQEKYNYNITEEEQEELINNEINVAKTFAIKIKDIIGICVGDVTIYKNATIDRDSIIYGDELLDFAISVSFECGVNGTYKGQNLSYDLRMIPSMLDEWNDKYVLRGNADFEQTAGGYSFNDEELEYLKTHVCLIFPKTVTCLTSQEELAQISIGFIDDDGNYTFTQPGGYQMLFGNFVQNPESISMSLFDSQDVEINYRVDAVVIAQRQCTLSYIKGDFSEFDALNDIKIPLTPDQYRFLKQPMIYF